MHVNSTQMWSIVSFHKRNIIYRKGLIVWFEGTPMCTFWCDPKLPRGPTIYFLASADFKRVWPKWPKPPIFVFFLLCDLERLYFFRFLVWWNLIVWLVPGISKGVLLALHPASSPCTLRVSCRPPGYRSPADSKPFVLSKPQEVQFRT